VAAFFRRQGKTIDGTGGRKKGGRKEEEKRMKGGRKDGWNWLRRVRSRFCCC